VKWKGKYKSQGKGKSRADSMGEEMTEVWRKDSGDAKTVCAIAIHLRYFSETWNFFKTP
jgi:hypothetical protein